jgi:hypothetical protein
MANALQFLAGQLEALLSETLYPLPEAIKSFEAKLDALANVSVSSLADVQKWLDAFKSLGDEAVRDTLLVRAVQVHLPRAAQALTLVGVFQVVFAAGPVGIARFRIDWDRARGLLNPSGGALGNPWTTALLEKANKLDDLKALQALTALAIVAPTEAVKLEYARQGFGALPLAGRPGVTLKDLIELVNSPLSMSLPSGAALSLADFMAKAREAAGPNGSLAVVGPDTFDPLLPFPFNGFGVSAELKPVEFFTGAAQLDLGGGWSAKLGSSRTGPLGVTAVAAGDTVAVTGTLPDLSLTLAKGQVGGGAALTVGSSDGTRLEVGGVSAALTLSPGAASPLGFRFGLDRLAVVVSASDLSLGLLGAVGGSDAVRAGGDFALTYSSDRGWKAAAGGDGAPGVRVTIPVNRTLGAAGAGVTVERLVVALEADLAAAPFRVRLKALATARAEIGPVRVTVDGAGVSLVVAGGPPELRAEPPSGVGLAVDAGLVSGGGFLGRLGSDEYAGALELKLLGLGAFAYGVYKKLPGGAPAVVALIGVRFPFPGVQLSWGFALTGLGGLVGVNRRADTDLLRDRLASGAAGNVLFNEDPARNAPTLLADLRELFPEKAGTFLVGPTLQLNWLFLVRLDVGLFVELGGPGQVFLAGSARIVIGASEDVALVFLRLDFIGGVDLGASLIYFDAALVNSHVLQVFRVTGGCALRLCYGPAGYFLLSVGGFHPAFNPGTLKLPKLDRCGATMSADAGVASAWLKMGLYFAVTPNTLQVGSSVEAGLSIGPIDAHGWFRFDAMVQFHPFYFQAVVDAGFDVEVAGVSLCGVRVVGVLAGPGPVVVHGEASVKILFVRISGSITVRFGSDAADRPEVIADLLARLGPELSDAKNLRASGDDPLVTLRPRPAPGGLPLVTPVGGLVWEQKRVPLKRDITRLDGVPLAGPPHNLSVAAGLPTTDEDDWFGLGTFTTLSGPEALNNAGFVRDVSGVRVGAGDSVRENPVLCPQTTDLKIVPEFRRMLAVSTAAYASAGLSGASGDRSQSLPAKAGAAMVTLAPERWTALDAAGRAVPGGTAAGQAFMAARGRGGVSVCASDRPVNLAGV